MINSEPLTHSTKTEDSIPHIAGKPQLGRGQATATPVLQLGPK